MADRFYVNWPLAPGPVTVQGPEAHHLAAVCRVRPGDAVCLFNGDGREYPARVTAVARRAVELDVVDVETPERESSIQVEVAAPLPKGDRAQFLIEKLTELGVASFVPLRTIRSVVHPRETKLDKLQRHVIEASKQCGRNVLMEVRPLTDWSDYCTRPDLPPSRWLAHPPESATAMAQRHEARQPWPERLTMAVGPEGGFTDEEVAAARAGGWRLVSLGPRILRVETAALVLASVAVPLHVNDS